MAAVAAIPGLSALLAWPTEHLTEAAENWEAVGGRCYGVANQLWRDALSVDWQGAAADTLRSATHADMLTTSAVADQLHAAAQVARSGASDLYAARSRVRYAVEDARTAGFDVGKDLSVTDQLTGESPARPAGRPAIPSTSLRQRYPPTRRPTSGPRSTGSRQNHRRRGRNPPHFPAKPFLRRSAK